MIVPSYAPPPIEIADNVAQKSYDVRLAYLRRVGTWFMGALLVVVGVSSIPIDPIPLRSGLAATFAILLSLSLVRNFAKGRHMELVVSTGMLLPFLISFGLTVRAAEVAGYALWPFAAALAGAWIYLMLCGRDLSFVAMFVAGSFVGIGAWVAALKWELAPAWEIGWGVALTAAMLFYWVYDLAALMTRRRLGEEMGAVADLFRDILNFTTYWVRVIVHWRRHKLWAK